MIMVMTMVMLMMMVMMIDDYEYEEDNNLTTIRIPLQRLERQPDERDKCRQIGTRCKWAKGGFFQMLPDFKFQHVKSLFPFSNWAESTILQVTEATYGREYQLQAMMDTPSEKYGLRVSLPFVGKSMGRVSILFGGFFL